MTRQNVAAALLLLLGLAAVANAQQARSVVGHHRVGSSGAMLQQQSLTLEQEAAVRSLTRKLMAESWRREEGDSSSDSSTEDSVSIAVEDEDASSDSSDESSDDTASSDDSSDDSSSDDSSSDDNSSDDSSDDDSSDEEKKSSSSSSSYYKDGTYLEDFEAGNTCEDAPAKSKYPFELGTAVSAYQVEGAAKTDGRGKSIWDTFAEEPGKIEDGSNAMVATDFYHKYKEDIKLLKHLGIRHFRFSISWPRIIPSGSGSVNEEGIKFYSDLIDELKANCIEPIVTLYHWDLPQKLFDKYQGWTDDQIVDDFADYAEVVFKEYGDRVKHWTTINEPYSACMLGYGWGVHAPGRCSDTAKCPDGGDVTTEPYLCAYNVVRAHARAAELFRKHVKDGKLGINLNIDWAEPADPENELDVESTERHYDLAVRIFADPLYKGDMPPSIRKMVPAVPEFTEEELELLSKAKPDFFALNHYTSNFIKFDEYTPVPIQYQQLKKAANGTSIGPIAQSEWLAIYPQGLRNVLNWVNKEYDSPTIFITENGVSVPGEAESGNPLEDDFRINYFKQYLDEVESAVTEDNINVERYYAWTFMDNFEWAEGYGTRFGLVHVNFETLERNPKKSSTWLASQFGLISKKDS